MLEIHKNYDLITYNNAISFMEGHVNSIINQSAPELIWLLTHNEVYTKGISAPETDLLTPTAIPIIKSNRGGKYTYHGPGIRIMYFMIECNMNLELLMI